MAAMQSPLNGGAKPSTALLQPHDAATVEGPSSLQRTKAEATLWKWNLAMCILHGVQAVVSLGAALSVQRLKDFRIPFTMSIADWSAGYPQAGVKTCEDPAPAAERF